MTELEKLEKRWLELVGKPRTKEEIEETLALGQKLRIERAKELKELIKELSGVGIKIESIWDMVNSKQKYPEAIGILMKHLPKLYSEGNREGIIRSLAVKEAAGIANKALIEEYEKTPKEKDDFRWVIGNSIFVTISKADEDKLIELSLDRSNGESRGRIVSALGKMKTARSEEVLIELLDDEGVCVLIAAIETLGTLKSKKARERISSLLNHSNKDVKIEARKALNKIDKRHFPEKLEE